MKQTARVLSLIFFCEFLIGLSILILIRPYANAAFYLDRNGSLIYQSDGYVLGDEDDNGGNSGSGGSGSGSSGSNNSNNGSSGSGSSGGGDSSDSDESDSRSGSGSTPFSSGTNSNSNSDSITIQSTKVTESENEDRLEVDEVRMTGLDEQVNNDQLDETQNQLEGLRIKTEEGRSEIIFGEGEKIKMRTKNGETRTDVYSGGVKVRFETKDGRLVIKAENEEGDETELGEQDLFKIEERLDKNLVKIATGSGESFIISRGQFGAQTHFPLSVDLSTNELTVTTPAGSKTVAVLPDQAVNNLLAANVIDKLGPLAVVNPASKNQISGIASLINLGERAGVPIYEIPGISVQKLLGFLPVEINKIAIVSVETGELISTSENFPNQILDLVSF